MAKEKNKKNKYRPFLVLLTLLLLLGGVFVLYRYKHGTKQAVVASVETNSSIPGWWYQQYFGTSVCAQDICQPDQDPDQDKLSNAQEFFYHTNPKMAFTVKDSLNDGQLVALGFDPSRVGHMTFDQVTSDDMIIGDSLVFNSDIKQLINESVDLTKISVPAINNAELNLSQDASQEAAATYLASVKQTFNKYLSTTGARIENAIKYGDEETLTSITNSLMKAVVELKATSVPPNFVQLHKYSIGFLQLLPTIFNAPPQDVLLDDHNPVGNQWYENAQATFSLYQKMTLETSRLQTQYQNAK